ncbi:MAG: TraB/GumN family protein [Clostridiales bacterium]|nr:TraB/GumN family protein [Clostridiales bacterium]
MKKKLLSILLALVMVITLLTPVDIQAANVETIPQLEELTPQFSPWAQEDLIAGDNYDIYPLSWYDQGMTEPITDSQLRVLIIGLRKKILKSEAIVDELDYRFRIEDNPTVEDVLNHLYSLIASYEYTKDIGLSKRYSPIAYMKEYGIYTGAKEELKLSELCSVEQACVFASRLITHLYDALDAGSKGFLWEIVSGENKVYLLGSIHMASYDIYPFSKNIRDAFHESDQVALELNLLDPTGAAILAMLGMYTDGTTLKDHVSEETYEKTIAAASSLGIAEQDISMFKPWMIYMMFTSLSGSSDGNMEEAAKAALLGIDMNITVNAMLYGKPILEIEGYQAQAMVLDSFSDELEEYLLKGVLDTVLAAETANYEIGNQMLNYMLDLWRKGDVEAFLTFYTQMTHVPELSATEIPIEELELLAEYNDKLLTQRDRKMAEYIDNLLQSDEENTSFVVVGSAHYISEYSVLDILEEKGYEIKQIK